jgi:hypothetical protein
MELHKAFSHRLDGAGLFLSLVSVNTCWGARVSQADLLKICHSIKGILSDVKDWVEEIHSYLLPVSDLSNLEHHGSR